MLIDTPQALMAFCDSIKDAPVLALDTEFLREKTYHPKLCLVQVATATTQAVIDTISLTDLNPLRALLYDTPAVKVFHACGQDLEVLLQTFGDVPRPIFDTQVAAGFLGQRTQMGLGALVSAYTGVHLDKADTLTDWSRRPLDQSQLAYAADDVRYLPQIYDTMMAELVQKDRLTWVLPEMDALLSKALDTTNPEDAFLHVKKVLTLPPSQMAICREVAAWRERTAQKRDIPRKWVLTDEVLIELCRRAPKTEVRVRRIRGTQALSESDVHAILLAIKRGKACPPALYPYQAQTLKPRPANHVSHEDAASVVDLMYAMLRLLAEHSGVAAQLIAKREDLADLAAGDANARLASGWRYQIAGQYLEELLSGKAGLTVRNGKLEII